MPIIIEGRLQFDFAQDWHASKFDEWSFYRGQYARLGDAKIQCKTCDVAVRCETCNSQRVAASKGIDILAVDDSTVCWCVEIKDYVQTHRADYDFLADIVALKVRDTLACLVAARLNAVIPAEQQAATRALQCQRIRIVLHLEIPPTRLRLHARTNFHANVQQKLKRLVQAIDSNPLVVSMNNMQDLPWTVTPVPAK